MFSTWDYRRDGEIEIPVARMCSAREFRTGSFDGTRNAHLRFRSIPSADKAFPRNRCERD